MLVSYLFLVRAPLEALIYLYNVTNVNEFCNQYQGLFDFICQQKLNLHIFALYGCRHCFWQVLVFHLF